MAEKKHTPGPWIWDEPSNWMGLSARVCNEKYEPIAQVQLSGWPKRIGLANARLIAAAPDLLAALRDLTEWLEAVHPDHPLLGLAHRTIAKAEPECVRS